MNCDWLNDGQMVAAVACVKKMRRNHQNRGDWIHQKKMVKLTFPAIKNEPVTSLRQAFGFIW